MYNGEISTRRKICKSGKEAIPYNGEPLFPRFQMPLFAAERREGHPLAAAHKCLQDGAFCRRTFPAREVGSYPRTYCKHSVAEDQWFRPTIIPRFVQIRRSIPILRTQRVQLTQVLLLFKRAYAPRFCARGPLRWFRLIISLVRLRCWFWALS